MKHLGSVWPLIYKKISSAKTKLLVLDFDGTLAKIAKTPHEVKLEKGTINALTVLSQSSSYRLAVISGRALNDLKSFFRDENMIYAGNHGLELEAGKLLLPDKAKKAKKLEALVWLLGEKIKEDLLNVPGILIEDKNYTLSVHYRNVSREHLPFFKQEIERFRKQYAHWPLIWRTGKKVWEVRPRMKWGKGDMALYLTRKFPKAFPIVVGDDDTDEDMFVTLRRRGITVRVGRSKKSSAEFYLNSPKEVGIFLERLSRAKA